MPISFEPWKPAATIQTHEINCSMDDSTGCVLSVRRNEGSPGVIETVVDGILKLLRASRHEPISRDWPLIFGGNFVVVMQM